MLAITKVARTIALACTVGISILPASAPASDAPPDSFCAECGLFVDPPADSAVATAYRPIAGYDSTAAEAARAVAAADLEGVTEGTAVAVAPSLE